MSVSLQIGLKQSQRLALTQSLRQSIEMLQLSSLELTDTISKEMLENPVLEQEYKDVSLNSRDDALLSELNLRLSGDNSLYERKALQRLNNSDYSDSGYSNVMDDDDRKRQFIESAVLQVESLAEHLIAQVKVLEVSPSMEEILLRMVTSLDEHGFFIYDKEEFIKEFKVDQEEFDRALKIVNTLEPVGCGAKDSHEALMIQAKNLYPDNKLLLDILENYFKDITSLNFEKVSKGLGVDNDEVVTQCHILQGLDPYPGRQFSTQKTRYIAPELEVSYVDEKIIISFIDDWVPELRINPYYTKLLNNKSTDKEIKDYIREKVRSASSLMKNISNRKNTIEKTVRAIMEHQRSFLDKGPGYLKPLVHGEIAEKVELHESTISRVTTNKFIQTPWGVFELKYFFRSKLKSDNSGEHSSDEVMRLIKDIISQEPPMSPYSDEEVVERLSRADIKVARRTIAKYRGILNIPSSSKRKRLKKIKEEGCL